MRDFRSAQKMNTRNTFVSNKGVSDFFKECNKKKAQVKKIKITFKVFEEI